MVKDGDLDKGGFGRLHGGGAQPMHSVLLMRIGDLVISEWTHEGKVRFFSDNGINVPTFYQSIYHPHLIRDDHNAQEAFRHHSNWKRIVTQHIYDHTGIRNPSYSTSTAPNIRPNTTSPNNSTPAKNPPQTKSERKRGRTSKQCVRCEATLPTGYGSNICIACNNMMRTR